MQPIDERITVAVPEIVRPQGTQAARAHGGGGSARRLNWRARQDSNLRPSAPEADALSTELQARGPRSYLPNVDCLRLPLFNSDVRRDAVHEPRRPDTRADREAPPRYGVNWKWWHAQ